MFALLAALSFAAALVYGAASPLGAFRLMLVIYFVVPTAIGFRAPGSFPLPILSLGRTFFAGFLLGYVVNRMFTAVPRRRLPPVTLFFAAYVAYVVATSFFSLSREWDVKALLSERVVGAMVAFIVAYGVVRNEDDFLYVLRGLYAGLLVIALIALGEAVTGLRFNSLPAIQSLSALEPTEWVAAVGGTGFSERGGILRVESTYEHSIYLGLALTLLLPWLLALLERDRSLLSRLAIGSSVTAAIFTVSRTAWFSIVAAAYLAGRRSRTLLVLSLLAVFLIGVPFLARAFQAVSYSDVTAFSMRSRTSLLLNTLQNLNPRTGLFGIGLGGLDYLASDYQRRQLFELATASLQRLPTDNSLAAWLLSVGAVGTTLFLAILYRVGRDLRRAVREAGEGVRASLLRGSWYCLVIEVTIFVLSNSLFQNPRLCLVFFGLLGASLGVALHETKAPQEAPGAPATTDATAVTR